MGSAYNRLRSLFDALSVVDKRAVFSFAEYLNHRASLLEVRVAPKSIQVIARPAEERVPAALKRLRLTYPMLEASDLLAGASDLLSQHLMLGRLASEVIDDLEVLFQRHYEVYCELATPG